MNESKRQAAVAWIDTVLKPELPENAIPKSDQFDHCINKMISEENSARTMVCSALIKLLDAEYSKPKTVYSYIQTGILHVHGLEKESREHLVAALLQLPVHIANIGLDLDEQVTRQDAGKLALEALEAGLNTLEDPKHLVLNVKLIELTGYRPALPNIQAIAEKTDNQELKKAAQEAVFVLKDSVRQCWEDTPPDLTSTLEQRCNHIKEALEDNSLQEQEVVQALYNATKDSELDSDSDPRAAQLEALLDNQSEVVKLATSYAIFRIAAPSKPLFKKAIDSIADIGVNGKNKGCCVEAGIILEEIAHTKPEQAPLIDQARERANLEFLERFKL